MQPFDYRLQVQDPVAMALAGYQQGNQMVAQREESAMNRELFGLKREQLQQQRRTLEQEQARAAEIQTVMGDVAGRLMAGGVKPEEIVSIGLQYPEISEQINSAYETLTETQKQGSIRELSRFAVALSRSPEVALQLVDERIAAAEEAGLVDEVQQLKAMKSMAEMDPSAPLAATMIELGVLMKPEEFTNFMKVAMPASPEAASAEGKVLQDYRAGLYGPVGSPEAQQTAKDAIARLSKPGTVVNVGGEQTEFDKAIGKGQAEGILAVSTQGQTARRNRQTLSALEAELAASPTGAEAAVKNMLGNLGVPTEGLSSIQAAEALISQLVPSQRPPGSGTMSDRDVALFKSSLPRLINTPEGNRKIIATMLAMNEYLIREGELADKVINGAITREDYRTQIQALGNPLAEFSAGGGGGGATPTRRKFDAQGREIK